VLADLTVETRDGNVEGVLNGDLYVFIESYLKQRQGGEA